MKTFSLRMKNTKVVRRIATNMMKKVKNVAVTSGTKLVLAFVTVKLKIR